ncbi:MAG: hypothetical protein ABIP61_14845 [Burkholderiaceae bacterium]
MLESFKRMFARPAIARDLSAVSGWAQRCGHGFKRARGEDGFVLDGVLEGKPWRLEWGPPQRAYIEGHELRLRMELKLPSDLQMLVLTRPLMGALERQTYEKFIEGTQTRIDTQTPEEMRWLVMFPKLDLAALNNLRLRFGAVASSPEAGLAWLEGPLANQLEHAAGTWLRGDPPFVLMTLRNRAYLRLQLAVPEPAVIAAALALFETAVTQALCAASGHIGPASGWNSSGSTAWQSMSADEPVVPGPGRS